jgi:hypothetical protein
MICLSLNTELAKIGFTTNKENCLSELRDLYQKCFDQKSELASLILGLFYKKEASLYKGENCIKELKAIIADLGEDYPLKYITELKITLAAALIENDLYNESQQILEEINLYSKVDIGKSQAEYIKKHLVMEKVKIVLKGKELILFSILENGPSEKFDLIFKVYGEDCDISKAERSFKTLLNRLRKKIDQEIILNTKNMYELH